MLYFSHMNLTREDWPKWRSRLQNSGFSKETAVLLDALAPFGFLLAQVFYLTKWLNPVGGMASSLQNLSTLLEDDGEIHRFARYLNERENDLS
jgi:hypothetical protein